MPTDDRLRAVDLARALVACPEWRWCEGMRAADTRRVCWVDGDTPGGIPDYDMRVRPDNGPVPMDSRLPDLSDAGTAGCLLLRLCQEWPKVAVYSAAAVDGSWCVRLYRNADAPEVDGPSLGEACARALLSLWAPP